ncbi:MAG: FTR1 family protein [Nocardiopsaceae bacterium]|nr:FTR1 family protein [Nocardiopsaceae bacterium]
MNIADAVPNLLIGLREGLEAGLVVSILLAALRKADPGRKAVPGPGENRLSSAPVWLGVAAAVALAGSFAAVLTFSTSVLSSSAQEAVGGSLSVLAVALVTAMVFWMRKTARTLSKQLRGEVERAVKIGAGALTVTAFLAVGREGLETTLFLWTAAKASGQTVAPFLGAAVGIAAAVILCALLYRQAVKLNIGVFFNRTAIALIVIAAGVFAYGLGDLQDAGLLPGQQWLAFDLTAHINPGSWWVSIITGVTELEPKMTVLQVAAWLAYLVAVIPAFLQAGRAPQEAPKAGPAKAGAAKAGAAKAGAARTQAGPPKPARPGMHERWERLAGNRPWTVGSVLVATPVIVAGAVIAAVPAAGPSGVTSVTVTKTGCASEWTAAKAGSQTITITNSSGVAGEINLDNSAGAVVAEIETIGPATSAPLTATLGAGTYTIKCLMGSRPATSSPTVTVAAARTAGSGSASGTDSASGAAAPVAVKPVTVDDLTPPNKEYQVYAATQLTALAGQVDRLRGDLGRGDLAAAKRDWLPAQEGWERVGASYDSFGDLGEAVDGLPSAYVHGVNDPGFQGLHRLEYGLWHGQSPARLRPVADTLAKNIAAVRKNLTSDDLTGDPTNLPLRGHEIIEDALRDHLSGMDDEGAGAAYAMTAADAAVDRVVIGYLTPLLNQRAPGLVASIDRRLDALERALEATRHGSGRYSLQDAPLLTRQHVNASIGQLLETLSSVPTLLEVPPTH